MEELLIIAVCLFLNGLFACYEMAFVTVTRAQLRQYARKGMESAKRLLIQRENPERALSVLQIGITLVGMISAAVGGAGAEESFSPILEGQFGLSERAAEAVAIVLVVIPLTYLSVVVGELVPKTIALRQPLAISLAGARWLGYADRILSPFVTFLEWSTKVLVKLLIPKVRTVESPHPPVELEDLSQQSQQYVLNLVSVETKRVRDVMIPWSEVDFANESDTIDELGNAILSAGHTRLPIVRNGQVIGILHTKEFITLTASGATQWNSIIRPHIKVRDDDPTLRALRAMQEKRSQMAIVHNSSGRPAGVVTFQDILEEIVGEIYDEDDDGRLGRILRGAPKFRFMVSPNKK